MVSHDFLWLPWEGGHAMLIYYNTVIMKQESCNICTDAFMIHYDSALSQTGGTTGLRTGSLSSSRVSSFLTLSCLTSRPPLLHSKPRGGPLFSFSLPFCKCSSSNFLCDLISSPFCDVLVSAIFASSLISFTFFLLPSLVRAKVPSDAGTSGWAFALCLWTRRYMSSSDFLRSPWAFSQSQSSTQFALGDSPLPLRKAQLLTCHCYAVCPNHCTIYSSTLTCPQSRVVRDVLCPWYSFASVHRWCLWGN